MYAIIVCTIKINLLRCIEPQHVCQKLLEFEDICRPTIELLWVTVPLDETLHYSVTFPGSQYFLNNVYVISLCHQLNIWLVKLAYYRFVCQVP